MSELRCSIPAQGITDEILGVGDFRFSPVQRMLRREGEAKVTLSSLPIRRPHQKVMLPRHTQPVIRPS